MEVYNLHRSTQKNKKYMADVIYNGKTYKNQHFGDNRYEQYEDSTYLKLYSNLNHHDPERKRLYHARHRYNTGIPSMLSKEFLW